MPLFILCLQVQCVLLCASLPVSAVHALRQLLVPLLLCVAPVFSPYFRALITRSPFDRTRFVMLLTGILQTITVTSLTNGLPLTAVPLSFVLIISMLREGIEDYGRYKSDLEVHTYAAIAY
jgi:hypothetical protein